MTTARVSGTFPLGTYLDAITGMFTLNDHWSRHRLKRALTGNGLANEAEPYLKTSWDYFDFNRKVGYAFLGGRKRRPSWDKMLKALVKVEHGKLAGDTGDWKPGSINDPLHDAADELSEAPVAVGRIGSVLPLEGRALSSAIHIHAYRGRAGVPFREHRVRKADGTVVSLRTRGQLGDLVTESALLRDLLHSAANDIRSDVDGHLRDMLSESKTAVQREQAYWAILDIEDDMMAAVKAKAEALTPSTAPPADADGAREWHLEQVETEAAAQRQAILGAETEQGMWAEGSCVAMTRTLTRLAEALHSGVRAIHRASTPAAMKTAADAALIAIRLVHSTGGGPAWVESGSTVRINTGTLAKSFTYDSDATAPQAFATLDARPPSAESRESECAITEVEIVQDGFAVARSVPSGSANAKHHRATITYDGDAAPVAGVAVRLVARNACGPSKMEISVAAPTPAPSGD